MTLRRYFEPPGSHVTVTLPEGGRVDVRLPPLMTPGDLEAFVTWLDAAPTALEAREPAPSSELEAPE